MKVSMPAYPIDLCDARKEATAAQAHELIREAKTVQQELAHSNILTSNSAMLRIVRIAQQVANTDVPVLMLGESGVGKDVFAHFIHNESNRFGNPFVKVNCAALPHELLESELFGHDKGAFTGAILDRPGKFEQANKGTLFLDEIAEMTPHLQAKLLHVLQDGEFSRLGSKRSMKVDVRILAATNRNLNKALAEGEFRSDLYFRLNVIQLQIPPLRQRREDIPLLANHFLKKYRECYASPRHTFPKGLIEEFIEHEWPGNVRELENVVKRYLILGDIDLPFTRDTAENGLTASANVFHLRTLGMRAADQAEREIALRVLDQTGWNQKECAKRLHISYKAFRNRFKRWGLRRDPMPSNDEPIALGQSY